MNQVGFTVSDKCIGCGKCIKVCPGGVLYIGEDKKPHMREFEEFGWNGCWKCEHCLAVCPEGAVSILDHRPEESLKAPEPEEAARVMDAIVCNRRSCRRYEQRNVLIVILEVIALVLNDVEQRRGSFVFETEGRLPKTDMIKVLILHLPCGDCTVFYGRVKISNWRRCIRI